jgi:GDPmannose 4,6-dehydratase
MKRALIIGLSGQDGSYLAEYLLSLNYQVYGLVHRETRTIRCLETIRESVEFLHGDLQDITSLELAFRKAWPDEIYNLAGQVLVPASWECPAETFDINVGGLARILQIVVQSKPDTRVYQASSSEMYGKVDGFCNEQTPFTPTSPYGISKMAAHALVRVFRDRGIFVVGGILFNHESPRRAPEMVTRKITLAAARWAQGDRTKLKLGNLKARKDWGFAGDYVRAMHAMLQQPAPKDYVIGTGESHSVAEFVSRVLSELQRIGAKMNLFGPIEEYVEVDPRLVRPNDTHDLRADARLAREELNWTPAVDFSGLVKLMVETDLAGRKELQKDERLPEAGSFPSQIESTDSDRGVECLESKASALD